MRRFLSLQLAQEFIIIDRNFPEFITLSPKFSLEFVQRTLELLRTCFSVLKATYCFICSAKFSLESFDPSELFLGFGMQFRFSHLRIFNLSRKHELLCRRLPRIHRGRRC